MRAQDWKGLVTNASPYALPPGAATEQTNLQAHVPGQMTTRGGMRRLEAVPGLDIYPYSFGGTKYLIALVGSPDSTAVIRAIANPSYYSTENSTPTIPAVSPSSTGVSSNYIGQFRAGGGEPPV